MRTESRSVPMTAQKKSRPSAVTEGRELTLLNVSSSATSLKQSQSEIKWAVELCNNSGELSGGAL